MEAFERFRTIPVFQRLEDTDLRAMAAYAHKMAFVPGDIIIREDKRGDAFYFIDRGRVLVSRRFDQDVVPLVELIEGDFFGESNLIGFELAPAMATVEARETTVTWAITRKAITAWEQENSTGVVRFFRRNFVPWMTRMFASF